MDFLKNLFVANSEKNGLKDEYSKINLPFPYVILRNNEVKYYNPMFKVEFKVTTEDSILELLQKVNLDDSRQIIEVNNNIYDTYSCKQVSNSKDVIILFVPKKNIDELNDFRKFVIGYIYIDNYSEVMNSVENTMKPMVEAVIDKKLNIITKEFDGLIQKYDKDKYIVVMRYSEYLKMKSNEFRVLEDVKKIKMGNNIPVTLSMGLGVNGETISENRLYANTAIDLALGRGGDQVILKNGDKFEIYGGNSEETTISNKVRARVKSNILCELIEESSNVIVLGHKYPDLDCLGACIGINKITETMGKKCNIVLNHVTSSIKNVHTKLLEEKDFDENIFVDNEKVESLIMSNTLIVVVDVNKKEFTESPFILDDNNKIVLIDHHRRSFDSIKSTVLTYHEPAASSTSELVVDLLYYLKSKPKFSNIEADALLAGIIIDTKNFTFKTSAKTFEAAAYLKRNNADTKRVNHLLQSDISEYKIKTEIVNSAVLHGEIAISKCYEHLENPNLIISQAADELLNLLGIEVAFVLAKVDDMVFVSARSFGDVNVQEIMEQLGGGGHRTMAATQIKDKTMNEVEEMILSTLNIEE